MNENFAGQTETVQPGQQQPAFDGTQQSPTFDGSQMPTFDGSQMPMMPPPPMFGGMQQSPMMPPPDANMWGNGEFAGNEMLNGNNFAPQNFGAPTDLTGIVDSGSTDISVNIGEQNNFAGFAQGGMMPPMFDGQGGQFNPPQQAAQAQAE